MNLVLGVSIDFGSPWVEVFSKHFVQHTYTSLLLNLCHPPIPVKPATLPSCPLIVSLPFKGTQGCSMVFWMATWNLEIANSQAKLKWIQVVPIGQHLWHEFIPNPVWILCIFNSTLLDSRCHLRNLQRRLSLPNTFETFGCLQNPLTAQAFQILPGGKLPFYLWREKNTSGDSFSRLYDYIYIHVYILVVLPSKRSVKFTEILENTWYKSASTSILPFPCKKCSVEVQNIFAPNLRTSRNNFQLSPSLPTSDSIASFSATVTTPPVLSAAD